MKDQQNAIEGKCFFINTDMIIRRSSYPYDLQEYNIVSKLSGLVCRGGSCIIDSYGHYLIKPVWDKNCTHCMACICYCPVEAIEYGKKSVGKPRYHFEKLQL